MLGIATPFCSCSAVPAFIGFVAAGVPIGVTLSFLISSPLVNEVAVVLLYGLFGWEAPEGRAPEARQAALRLLRTFQFEGRYASQADLFWTLARGSALKALETGL
jgi:hypothetical protein